MWRHSSGLQVKQMRAKMPARNQRWPKQKKNIFGIYRTPLLSTGKCKISDLPEENILWAVEIQFFTRSSIDFILNFADECTGYGRKIGAFWDILPDKFVGIFNSTLLPRRKWICEKHYIRVWSSLRCQGLWNHLMAAEFRAIVCCNWAHCMPVRQK